ncbi:Hypothetical protein SMAX5B_011319 [Scophthalmus maximus]|uniref:Uncharacterized protein n=1 Tax=Scophthalmus maximus TaxID=52904 RepID=A0A2U9BMD1_SCOMX|nr:Hypothetical protein SMAX5B_011319 [Scophthalmus maximus]
MFPIPIVNPNKGNKSVSWPQSEGTHNPSPSDAHPVNHPVSPLPLAAAPPRGGGARALRLAPEAPRPRVAPQTSTRSSATERRPHTAHGSGGAATAPRPLRALYAPPHRQRDHCAQVTTRSNYRKSADHR